MRKILLLTLLILSVALPAFADEHHYWTAPEAHVLVCQEGLEGCKLLQMVMTGVFDSYDPEDTLNGRILAAALSKLCAVSDADFAHFLRYFTINEGTLRRCWYIALANCLWADIDLGVDPGGTASAARRVLRLFLDPSSETDAAAQIAAIRSETDDAAIALIADPLALPHDFVRYLIFAEDWRSTTASILPME